jgi:hypothetical protein
MLGQALEGIFRVDKNLFGPAMSNAMALDNMQKYVQSFGKKEKKCFYWVILLPTQP